MLAINVVDDACILLSYVDVHLILSLRPGALPWRRRWEITIGASAPRRSTICSTIPTMSRIVPAAPSAQSGKSDGNSSDFPSGWACRRRCLTAVLDGVVDFFDEAQIGIGEQAEAQHEGHEARPREPSCLGFRRGDLAEEVLALLDVVHVLLIGVVDHLPMLFMDAHVRRGGFCRHGGHDAALIADAVARSTATGLLLPATAGCSEHRRDPRLARQDCSSVLTGRRWPGPGTWRQPNVPSEPAWTRARDTWRRQARRCAAQGRGLDLRADRTGTPRRTSGMAPARGAAGKPGPSAAARSKSRSGATGQRFCGASPVADVRRGSTACAITPALARDHSRQHLPHGAGRG